MTIEFTRVITKHPSGGGEATDLSPHQGIIRRVAVISEYHAKYQSKSDDEIVKRARERFNELTRAFSAAPLDTASDPVEVAVMGCGDKRFVAHHKDMFARILARNVRVTTFDIEVDHLAGEENVIQHDCSQLLPGGLYDVTFGHVVLPFLAPDKQLDMIAAGYNALKQGGIQIQALDPMNYDDTSTPLPGLHRVDLGSVKRKANQLGARVIDVGLDIGVAIVIVHP